MGITRNTFPHLWCAAPPGAQAALIAAASGPDLPATVCGARGWIGVRLDGQPDWDAVEILCTEAFRTVAPRKWLAMLDSGPDGVWGPTGPDAPGREGIWGAEIIPMPSVPSPVTPLRTEKHRHE